MSDLLKRITRRLECSLQAGPPVGELLLLSEVKAEIERLRAEKGIVEVQRDAARQRDNAKMVSSLEAEVERLRPIVNAIDELRRQRDQAWIALAAIEDEITSPDGPSIELIIFQLAGYRMARDGDEFNAVLKAAEAAEGNER